CTPRDLLIEEADALRAGFARVGLGDDMLRLVGLGPATSSSGLTVQLAVQLNGRTIRTREWAVTCNESDGTIAGKHGTPRKNLQLIPMKSGKPQSPVATQDHILLDGVGVFSPSDLITPSTAKTDSPVVMINLV